MRQTYFIFLVHQLLNDTDGNDAMLMTVLGFIRATTDITALADIEAAAGLFDGDAVPAMVAAVGVGLVVLSVWRRKTAEQ